MGRKPIEIDLGEVERLAGLGLTDTEICASLSISDETLRTRRRDSLAFLEAIKRGKAIAGGKVANKLFEQCLRGNVGAIVWYEKTRRGLREATDITSGGKPIESKVEVIPIDYRVAIAALTTGSIEDSDPSSED